MFLDIYTYMDIILSPLFIYEFFMICKWAMKQRILKCNKDGTGICSVYYFQGRVYDDVV